MKLFNFNRGIELLRQPDRSPRCYEMTEAERLEKIRQYTARNVWNDPELAKQDVLNNQYYGA